MNKLYCNEGCQKEFTIDDLQESFQVEALPNNVERYYLECPHCKHQYTSYYLNDSLKKIRREIQKILRQPVIEVRQKNKLAALQQKLYLAHETLKAEVNG